MAGSQNTSAKGRGGLEDRDLEGLPEDPSLREVIGLRAEVGQAYRAVGTPHIKRVLGRIGMAIFRLFHGEDETE